MDTTDKTKLDETVTNQRVNDVLTEAKRLDLLELGAEVLRDGGNLQDFRTRALEEIGKRNPETREIGFSLPSGKQFSITNVLRSFMPNERGIDIGYELEVSQELQRQYGRKTNGVLIPMQRAITYSGTSGVTVSTDHLDSEFVDVLRARSVVMQLAGTQLSGLVGNVSIPRKTAGSTAYWIAGDDSDSLTASTPTFDSISRMGYYRAHRIPHEGG